MVSLQSFEYFMASFLWSIRVEPMENCGPSVFYDNIYFSPVVASRPLPTARSDVFLVVFRIFALPLQLKAPTHSQKFLPIC